MLDSLLPIWNPFIVHPLMALLRLVASPLVDVLPAGAAGVLATIIVTVVLRLILMPLSLMQIRSQRKQMAVQPELKALQKKFKGDREGLAREQMKLYKERGINPAAGCLPLLIQLPILFGMYAAMQQMSTTGWAIEQVTTNQLNQTQGQLVYAAHRDEQPLPYNTQFVLTTLTATATTNSPITIQVDQNQSQVSFEGTSLLSTTAPLTLTPGQPFGNPNPPNTPSNSASIFLRAGIPNGDGTETRNVPLQVGQPFDIEVWIDASQTSVDSAQTVVSWDPSLLNVSSVSTPTPQDLPFKSPLLWLPSLGQPDVFHLNGLTVPGFLLILMTISSYLSQRMTTMPTEDPQQQMMMRSMAFMPLMYLFFFLNTPSGLVLYWLVSNVYSMFQQYFTVGLGLLGGDIYRLTGRDLQPPWAHVPTTASRSDAALSTSRSVFSDGNGRADDLDETEDTTPAVGSRAATAARRSGKGRRRGKR